MVEAIAQTADKVAHAIRLIAADALEVSPDKIELKDGYVKVADGSNRGMPFRRIASRAHWNPNGLPAGVSPGIYESTMLSPPTLGVARRARIVSRRPSPTASWSISWRSRSSAQTGAIRIDKYVSVHDVGRQLNPLIVEGQVHGGFAHGLGAALMEELAYDERGNFLSGTFADYLCPTAMEVPPVTIGHVETRVADECARRQGHGRRQLDAHARRDRQCGRRRARPRRHHAAAHACSASGRLRTIVMPIASAPPKDRASRNKPPGGLRGEGEVTISAPPAEVWRRLIDPDELAAIVPGCREPAAGSVRIATRAEVMIGVAGIRGALRGGDRAQGQAGTGVGAPRRQGDRARSASAPAKAS